MIIIQYLSNNINNKLTKSYNCDDLFNEETLCICEECKNLFKLPEA